MTPKRYFFIVLLFLYTPLFIKGYANTTKEFSDVIVPEFPLQVKFANELVDLDRLDMYEPLPVLYEFQDRLKVQLNQYLLL